MPDLSPSPPAVVVTGTGQQFTGEAGQAITAGQPVYLDTATNLYKLAVNSSAVLANVKGVALNNASLNQPIRVITQGSLDPGDTTAVGTIYVLSSVAGNIQTSADNGSGEFVTIIGVATSTSNIEINVNVSGVAVP